MKYEVKFRIHEPTNSLVIDMENFVYQWVADILNNIKANSQKKIILSELADVDSGVKKEAFYSDELNEIKITPKWVYWNEDILGDYDTSTVPPIELEEFKKLLEVWWNKYVETEGQPEV